jgi:enoyl-[acyl-carrier protein] reductase II
MLHTPICDLLGIQAPIIQAAIAPYTSAELVAAVVGAGGFGSIGTAMRSADEVKAEIARTKEMTDRPFAVNFTMTSFSQELWDYVLEARPAAISLALGDPGDLVQQAHDAGARVIQQVHTVEQGRQAVGRGVDAIIAQGTEAGGFGGVIATMTLVPQVVDAVAPIPVLAAGGIADGRGLAAALTLGAQGVNVGTRFLATTEAPINDHWKQMIVDAKSEDAVKVEFLDSVFPKPEGMFETSPRSLRTTFIDEWNTRRDDAVYASEHLRALIVTSLERNHAEDMVPFGGQSAGLIHEILPAAEVVRRMVADAELALDRAGSMRSSTEGTIA